MADYLFVSQDMIDGWLMEGKIDFSGNVMSIRGEEKRYVLESAVRFVRVVGDEPDSPGLLAKVKTLEQVASEGGEHYHDSVILGDVAYDVQNGFIARVHVPDPVAAAALEKAAVEEPRPRGSGRDEEAARAPEAKEKEEARLQSDEAADDSPAKARELGPVTSPPEESAPAERAEGAGDETDLETSPREEESDEALLTRFLLENLK